MNLIQMKKAVEEQDRKKSKLLGQKEMLLKNLNKLGFKSTEEAKKKSKELKATLSKMLDHYEKGKEQFKEDYGYLLE